MPKRRHSIGQYPGYGGGDPGRPGKFTQVRQGVRQSGGGFRGSSASGPARFGNELKYQDLVVGAGPARSIPATWALSRVDPTTFDCLVVPQQGNSQITRIGRQVTIKSVTVKGAVTVNWDTGSATAADDDWNSVAIKVLMVMDTQTNGAVAAGNLIMDEQTEDKNNTLSFRDLENSRRFKILATKTFIFTPPQGRGNATASQVMNQQARPFVFSHKCNTLINFITSTGAVADISDNSFHMYAVLDDAWGGSTGTKNAAAGISYISRVRFVG